VDGLARHCLALSAYLLTGTAALDAKAEGSASDVSAKPAQSSAAAAPLPPTTSDIGASAGVTLSALSSALSAALPSTFEANGRQRVCADLNEVAQEQIQKKIGGDFGRWLASAARNVTQNVNQLHHACQDVGYTVSVNRTARLWCTDTLKPSREAIV
jgi:hypothetical protein